MVEYQLRYEPNVLTGDRRWVKYNHRAWGMPVGSMFSVYYYRIDGTVYESCTENFKKAYEKSRAWDLLAL